jgi:hypothetical protein
MKYYCYNNNVEVYNKQPLLKDAIIFTVLNSSQNEIDFVTDFVKNNGGQCKNNSYITLVKGSRKKFIKNNKSKSKILNKSLNPIFFYTPKNNKPIINEPSINEPSINEPIINEPIINEPIINEPIINEPSNQSLICKDCDNRIEQFKEQTNCLLHIKKGDKLYINNGIINVDNSYNGFSRMIKNIFWSGYNRNHIIEKLENIFNIDFDNDVKEKNCEYLVNIKKGLSNLLETYIDDNIMKSRLINIINKLD